MVDINPTPTTSGDPTSTPTATTPAPSVIPDDLFKQMFEQPAAIEMSHNGGDATQLSDQQFSELFASPKPGTEVKATSWYTPVKPYVDYYAQIWQNGEASETRGVMGFQAFTGQVTYEDVKRDAGIARLKSGEQKTDTFEKNIGAMGALTWVGHALGAIPFMRDVTLGGVKGALIGGAIGAGVGLLGGPAAEITVPGGATVGATWGYRAGAFTTAGKITAGQMYLDLRDRGISDGTAKAGAFAAGAVSGLLATVQFGQLNAIGRRAVLSQLVSTAGKGTVTKFVMEYAKEMGVQVGLAEAQQMANVLTQEVTSISDKHPDAMPTEDEILKGYTDTFINAAETSAILVGGMKAGGASLGRLGDAGAEVLGNQIKKRAEMKAATDFADGTQAGANLLHTVEGRVLSGKTSLMQAFDILQLIHKEHSQQAPTEEHIQAVKNADVNTVLDHLQQAVFGENGQVRPNPEQGILDLSQMKPTVLEGHISASDAPVQATEGPIHAAAPSSEEPLPIEMKARVNQINTDLRSLDASIDDVQQQIDARDVSGAQAELQASIQHKEEIDTLVAGLEKKFHSKDSANTDTTAVLDKLEEAYQNQELAAKRVKKAQKRIGAIDPKKTDTKALEAKISKLYEQRGTLQTEKDLIHERLLTPEEIKNKVGQLKVGQISSMRIKALQRELAQFKQGMRRGVKYARDEVNAVQKDVITVIRQSGMEPKDQAKFIQKIRSIQTQAQLDKVFPEIQDRIGALVEASSLKSAHKRLTAVVNQTELKKSGKYPQSKFSAPIQKVLTAYRRSVRDPEFRARAQSRSLDALQVTVSRSSESLQETLKNPNAPSPPITMTMELTPEQLLETLVSHRVGDLENKSAEEVNKLTAEIQDILDTGRAEALDKKLAEAAQRQENIQTAIESIQGNKPVDSVNPANSKLRLDTVKNVLVRIKRTGSRTLNSWDGVIDILSQHDSSRALDKIASVHEAIRSEANNYSNSFHKMVDTVIQEAGGNRKAVLDMMVKGANKEELGVYTDQDGTVLNLYASRNEAAKVWLQMQDPTLERGLREGNKYTWPGDVATGHSTFEMLEEKLTPQEKKAALGMRKFYGEYLDKRLNPEWEEATGATLEKNPFYSGYAQREGFEPDATTMFFHEQASRSSNKPKSTIARTDNAYPLRLKDLYTEGIQQVQAVEHWASWWRTDRNLRPIFANEKVRNIIELKYGSGMLHTVDFQYNDMIGTRLEKSNEALRFLDLFRRNAGTAFVGGKAMSFFKQYSAVANFLLHISPGELATGMGDFFNPTDIKRKIDIMESSPLLKARVATFDRDLAERIQRQDISKFNEHPSLMDLSLWAVKYGDRAAVWSGGWAVYKSVLAKTGSHEEAIRAFEKAFNTTQQSGTPDQLSQLAKSGPMGKMMTLFVQQPIRMLEFEVNSARRALSNPSRENLYKAARTVLITHGSQTLFQAVASGLGVAVGAKDVEDAGAELARAFILGPANELPLIGDILNSSLTLGQNWFFERREHIWDAKFIPYEAANQGISLMKNVGKAMANGDVTAEEFFQMIHQYARSFALLMPKQLGGGQPIEPYTKFLEYMFTEPKQKPDNH